jgi:hypothetical protein
MDKRVRDISLKEEVANQKILKLLDDIEKLTEENQVLLERQAIL